MMSSAGLHGKGGRQASCRLLQTSTDDDNRHQRPLLVWPPYTTCRQASNNMKIICIMSHISTYPDGSRGGKVFTGVCLSQWRIQASADQAAASPMTRGSALYTTGDRAPVPPL